MKNPKVTFCISQELDNWKIVEFFKMDSNLIFRYHPEIKKHKTTKEKIKYINKIYKNQLPAMKENAKTMQNKWDKVRADFFKTTNDIFKINWSKGEYKAFLTITPPYPRFLDSKIFQVESFIDKKNSWLKTTIHEILHFIFYEFIRLNYTSNLDNTYEDKMSNLLKDKFKLPLWDISEIHAVILLNSPKFQKILPLESKPYSQHKTQYHHLLKLWQKTRNIKKFMMELEQISH